MNNASRTAAHVTSPVSTAGVDRMEILDIALSMYKQEKLITKVLAGILNNTTTPFNLVLLFDGSDPVTRKKVFSFLNKHFTQTPLLRKIIIGQTPDVRETLANNAVFRLCEEDFMITLQDDVIIKEYGWERRLTFPLRKYKDVLAVTSRAAHNVMPGDGLHEVYANRVTRENMNQPRDLFAVRDLFNRGPVAFRMEFLRKLGYLRERYAPCNLDDADLSLRAWKEHKWKVGSFWIDYISKHEWGPSHSLSDSIRVLNESIKKHTQYMYTDHADYINSGQKHDEDIIIPESEIDYITKNEKQLAYLRDIETEYWRLEAPSLGQRIKWYLENKLEKSDPQFKEISRKEGIKKALSHYMKRNKTV